MSYVGANMTLFGIMLRHTVIRRIAHRLILRVTFGIPERKKREAWVSADVNSGMVE